MAYPDATSATGTTEFIDVTTADVYIPEIWSPQVVDARENNLLFAALVDSKYEKDLTKGDVIHVQTRNHLSTTAKTANTAVNYETLTETQVDITINKHYYSAIAVEEIVDAQAFLDQAAMYAPELGYALALQEDDDLAALVDNFSQNVGTLITGLSDENVRRAVQYLDDANAPDEDRVMIVSPAEWSNLIGLDRYVHSSYEKSTGQISSKAKRGHFGSIYGLDCFKSTNVEGTNAAGHDNCVMQQSALALVRQIMPKTVSQYDIDYLARKVVSHELYGVQEIRDDHGVWAKGA